MSKNADASTHTHTHRRTAQLEDSSYLLISAMFMHLQAKILPVASLFLVSFIFASDLVVNSCRTQKVCRIRNAPICHHLAQEAAGQDLKEICNWGLDSNEVLELEA